MRFFYTALFVLFIGGACTRETKQTHHANENVVIIKDESTDRIGLARLISKVSNCNPKVIGVNALFIDLQDVPGDSALTGAIKNAGNVILPTNIEDGKLIRSNKYFSDHCQAEGLSDFTYKKVFTSYQPYAISDWSFPVTVVSHYSPEIGETIMDKTIPNKDYEISYSGENNQFKIHQSDSIDCIDLKDKIVLIGYVGPNAEDLVPTPWDENGTYTTIVLAKMISNLLENQY